MAGNHNNQYQKNERRILEGYLEELKRKGVCGNISLKTISEVSGLPYRTILGHYKNFPELERSVAEETLQIVFCLVDECRIADDDYRTFLRKLLLAVVRESTRFQIDYYRQTRTLWEEILSYSKNILTKKWSSYDESLNHIIFHRFCFDFMGTICLWGENDFSVTELKTHLATLIFIVENAAKRELF